jgi:hypothetical protein
MSIASTITEWLELGRRLAPVWHKTWCFLALEMAFLIAAGTTAIQFITFMDGLIRLEMGAATSLLPAVGSILGMFALPIVWVSTTSCRKARKGKIGLGIAVVTESETEYRRIRNDFIRTIQTDLGAFDNQIDVVVQREHHSVVLSEKPTEAALFHRKTRCWLLVYGSCSTRMQDGNAVYHMKIFTSISHGPIPLEASTRIGQQMLELVPYNHVVPADSELVGFMLMSAYFALVAKYLIGLSAQLSGDLLTALNYYEALLSQLGPDDDGDRAKKLIRQKCEPNLVAVLSVLSERAYRESQNVGEMHRYSARALEIDCRCPHCSPCNTRNLVEKLPA